MSLPDSDKVFAGSVPQLYDEYLLPLIFDPYAIDISARTAARRPGHVLEIAAGTGAVTRHLATDLNPGMIETAKQVGTSRPVQWQQADAMQLPFDAASFDVVVCQFGVMFFPDRPKAYAEARRVLKPGGVFLFNAWDRLADNEFAETATDALATVFPQDPPRFMARTPHGYHERAAIERDLASGGFEKPARIATVTARSRAPSAREPAIAYCQGTPLRSEIEARDAAKLGEATDVVAKALAQRFGTGAVDGKIQAHVVSVEK